MPKKRKTAPHDKQRSIANGSSSAEDKTGKKGPRAKSNRPKKSEATRKTAATAKKEKGSKRARVVEPADEAIQLRAYFIAERRHRLDLPGDANNDWIEARRQLVAEASATG